MKRKKRITNRTFLLTAVIGSFLIIAMVTANSIWSSNQTLLKTEETVSAVSVFYLDTMADRRAQTVSNQISNEFDQMEKALAFIRDEKIESQEELRDTLGKIRSLLSLNRFALVDRNDIVYTQYTTYTGKSRHEFLSAKKMDDRIISTVSLYGSSKQLCLAIPTPDLTIMGKSFKACFVQIDIQDIINLLAVDDQGRTYFALYTKNGSNLSGTELGPVISNRNILEATKGLVSEEVWKENCDRFAEDARGSMTFSSGDVKGTMCYVPIPDTGWKLAVLIHESVILDQIRDISEKNLSTNRNQIVLSLLAVLSLSSVLFLELMALSKDKLDAEKKTSKAFQTMVNIDSLTGVRNKHAYSEYEDAVDQKIQNHEIQALAVVVCDINGLKYVNDTQGHAAGDQLIKDACALICESFPHGAVFRVGGDEFVVILQEKGYETMDEALGKLNKKVEENINEDGVVVAAGSSVLQPDDRQLCDVFTRADHLMYERKSKLKALGAKTRET